MSTQTLTGVRSAARPATQTADAHPADARSLRRRRAAIARRLIAAAPDIAPTLDWDALDAAPAWLTMSDGELMVLARQVGAMLCASTLRLWIDGARLNATRAAVGVSYLQALLAMPEAQLLPRNVAPCPRIDTAEQVAPMLRTSGLAVLIASLPNGGLRRAAVAMLGTTASSMAQALAQSLVSRAQALVARNAPTSAPAVKSPLGTGT